MNKVNDNLWSESIAFIEGVLRNTRIPGCSVGVLHQDEIKAAGFGYSNIEIKSPVSANTLFQIGSISKTFTATVALKFVEEGKLDIHLPVRTYLPEFKVADEMVSAEVTLYHLLTHSAGWDGDLFVETGDGDDAVQKFIQRMAVREQFTPLGQYFSYNNSGFAVLGGILEAISQKRLEDLFRTYIIEPLELKRLFFNAAEVITADFSVGHKSSPEGVRVARPWRLPRARLPIGGIVTDVCDLLGYARCYLAKGMAPNGKQVLKPETVAEMFAPKLSISKEDRSSVGYSWLRSELDQGYLVGHGGGTNGQITQLSLVPEHNFALAIFTNSDRGGTLIQEVERYLLKTYLGVEYATPKEIESTPEQLAVYAGTASRPGFNFYVEMMGKHLIGLMETNVGYPTENEPPPPPEPPFRLGRCAEDRLIVLDGDGKDTPIDVIRDPQGKINYLRLGRLYRFNPKTDQ